GEGATECRHHALGESRMVKILIGRSRLAGEDLLLGDVDDLVPRLRRGAGAGADFRRDVGNEVSDALLGGGLARDGELLVVALPHLRIAQYAAGMIDETKSLFDVALAVASLCVILAYEAAQRRAHLLVRGGGRDSESFVERRFHGRDTRAECIDLDAGIFG